MTDMSARPDPDLLQLFEEIFSRWREGLPDHVPSRKLDQELWRSLSDTGLTTLGSAGGEDAGWVEAAALARIAAWYAAPVPLIEHDLLAGWLLGAAGQPLDERSRTAAVLDTSGIARAVPWASQVERIVVLWESAESGPLVADIDAGEFRIDHGADLAASPRDTIAIDPSALSGFAVPPQTFQQFRLRGALARAAQTVGAMERSVQLAVEHATTRKQFGRSISAFQAVQHLIATAAGETALAAAAVDAALGTAVDELDEIATAVAKSVVGHAASVVARATHQVLGAIGTTQEHELHLHTTAMLAWQQEFGSVAEWDRTLSTRLIEAPGRAWELIARTERA